MRENCKLVQFLHSNKKKFSRLNIFFHLNFVFKIGLDKKCEKNFFTLRRKLNATKRSTWHVSTSSKVMKFVFLFILFLLSRVTKAYTIDIYLIMQLLMVWRCFACDVRMNDGVEWVDSSHFDFLSNRACFYLFLLNILKLRSIKFWKYIKCEY